MAITLFGLCAQRVVPIGSLVNLIFDCIRELLCHLFAVVSFICINDLISLVNQLTNHFRICDIGRGYHHIYDTLAIGVYFVVHLVSDMASVILDSYSGIQVCLAQLVLFGLLFALPLLWYFSALDRLALLFAHVLFPSVNKTCINY